VLLEHLPLPKPEGRFCSSRNYPLCVLWVALLLDYFYLELGMVAVTERSTDMPLQQQARLAYASRGLFSRLGIGGALMTCAFSAAAWGQGAGNAAPGASPTGITTPAPTAAGFYAAGVAALPQSRPEPTAWAAGMIPVSAANGLSLIVGQDYTLNAQRQIVPVSFAGPATLVKQLTFGQLWGYIAGGGGTAPTTTALASGALASSTTASLALTGGGFIRGTIKSGKWWWIFGAAEVSGIPAANGQKTSQTVVHLGIGGSW
jgi:hypothetical protein